MRTESLAWLSISVFKLSSLSLVFPALVFSVRLTLLAASTESIDYNG